MTDRNELLDELTEAMYDRESSCHITAPAHQRDKAIDRWHTAVEAIARALDSGTPTPPPVADAVAREDAARYRWLRDTLQGAKAGGGVEVNTALQYYEKPEAGKEVRIYWYRHTPVGFFDEYGSTLDAAIDAARRAGEGLGNAPTPTEGRGCVRCGGLGYTKDMDARVDGLLIPASVACDCKKSGCGDA